MNSGSSDMALANDDRAFFSVQRAYSVKRQLGVRLVSWPRALHFHGSVLPRTALPIILSFLWGLALVAIDLNLKPENDDSKSKKYQSILLVNPIAMAVISGILSLTIVFRNNAAFEKYAEGRRIWGTLHTSCRNLARVSRTCALSKGSDRDLQDAFLQFLGLLLDVAKQHMHNPSAGARVGLPWAVKNPALAARLHHLIEEQMNHHREMNARPIDALLMTTNWIFNLIQAKSSVFAPAVAGALAQLHNINDAVSQMDRIAYTSMPPAFQIHTFQILTIYLVILPFQILDLEYFVPFVCACAAFTLYGVAAIGSELMNPFGIDLNDIKLVSLTDLATREMKANMQFPLITELDKTYDWPSDAMIAPALELPEFSPNTSGSQFKFDRT